MSRSGYSDDNEGVNLWRGAVNSAIHGKRGQALLRDLLAALDAMPEKRLVAGKLEADGEFCALGVVGQARGMNLATIDTSDVESLGPKFNIAEALAREIMWVNDEHVSDTRWIEVEIFGPLRPWDRRISGMNVPNEHVGAQRWKTVREWVEENIAKVPA
jgi:hypothetical protein